MDHYLEALESPEVTGKTIEVEDLGQVRDGVLLQELVVQDVESLGLRRPVDGHLQPVSGLQVEKSTPVCWATVR